MPLHELHRKLGRLRAHLRRLILLTGTSRLVLVAVGVLAVALFLDWSARLETPGRVVLLALAACATGYTLWRFLVAPLRVRLGDEQLALALERRFPALRDRLISTVQFARVGDPAPLSRAMLERLTRETLTEAAALDFEAASTAKPTARWALAAALTLVLASLYTLHFPATAAIFAARFFNPLSALEWPRRTQLTILAYDKDSHQLVPEGNRIYVPKGEDLHLLVRAARFSGELWTPPARIAVHYRFAGGGSGRRFVAHDGSAAYSTYCTTVTEGFACYATGDDARSSTYEVHVRNRPRIESIRITLRAPAYTGKPARILADGSGSIAGVAGSVATVEIATNKPVAPAAGSARLLVNGHAAFPMSFIEGDATRLRGSFRLQAGQKHYAVALVDADGLTNSSASTYRLDVRPDRKPVVSLPEPGASRKVTPKATVPIRVVAKDDYEVRRPRFLFRRGENAKPVAHALPAPDPPSDRVERRHDGDLTSLARKEREVLRVYAEAEDNYTETRDGQKLGPNVGRSPVYLLTVISEAEMTSLIQRRLQELKARLEKTIERQERAKDTTDRLANAERKLERRQLKSAEREQVKIAAGTRSIADKLDQALADMQHNNVGNLEERRRVEELSQALKPLAAKDMPDAARKIATASQSDTKPKQSQHLAAAVKKQHKVLGDLRAALARFDQWTDIDELVRDASELLLQQKKLNERTAQLARKLFGKPARMLSAEEKGAARSLARAQRAARDAMKNLENKMARTAQRLQQPDPAAAKAVQQALSQANADQIRARMENAAAQIQQAKPASALPLQAKSAEALKRLLDTLNRARSPYLARDVRKLQESVAQQLKDIKRLLKQQKRHLAETQIANLRRQLQSLRDQQAATHSATKKATSPAGLSKQATGQTKHAKDAGELERQLERLSPPEQKHKDPLDKAAKNLREATSQMQQAAQSLAGAKPNQPDAKTQAARAQATKAQTQAIKKLGEADRQLAKLQKQLAEGKTHAARLPERARDQQKTRQQADRTAQGMQKTSEQAKPILPKTAKAIQQASARTKQAAQAMARAKQQLDRAAQKPARSGPQQSKAQQDQQQAARDLEKARDQLAKAHQKPDLQRRQQEIFELGKTLAAMLVEQVGIRKNTEALDAATEAGRKPFTHAQKLHLHDLTDAQGKLHKLCGDLVIRLQKEGVPVFHYVMTDTTRSMVEVQKFLSEGKVGWLTQETERDVERNLAQLLGALKQEAQRLAKKRQQQRPGGGRGGQSPDKPQPLVPPLAQLKQLRTLQAHINEKTRELQVDKQTQLARRRRLFQRRAERLARKQQELGKLSERFADALEEQNTEEQMAPP